MQGDGNGWVRGPDGARHWGRHGAAGLLLRAAAPDGAPVVLVQHRAAWSHHGGTWGLPGGARDSHESTAEAALREAREETGIAEARVAVRAQRVTSTSGGWSYTTVVADTAEPLDVHPDAESTELRWVAEAEVADLPLHPGLVASWGGLRTRRARLLLDTANVLGSRPDGWWRDRAGATARLLAGVVAALPRTAVLDDGFVWLDGVEAVLEGAARDVRVDAVTAHRAVGSGDDELVRVAGPDHLVVTADRGLIARLPECTVIGPREVLGWLAPASTDP